MAKIDFNEVTKRPKKYERVIINWKDNITVVNGQ
jgi:hypothetical protein